MPNDKRQQKGRVTHLFSDYIWRIRPCFKKLPVPDVFLSNGWSLKARGSFLTRPVNFLKRKFKRNTKSICSHNMPVDRFAAFTFHCLTQETNGVILHMMINFILLKAQWKHSLLMIFIKSAFKVVESSWERALNPEEMVAICHS